MIRSLHDLVEYEFETTDGDVGRVDDYHIDDFTWSVRYLELRHAAWPSKTKVLLPSPLIRPSSRRSMRLDLDLSRHELERTPSLTDDESISREKERSLHGQLGLEPWWNRPLSRRDERRTAVDEKVPSAGDVHEEEQVPSIHSLKDIVGYDVHGKDAFAGKITDLACETDGWFVRFLVIDTYRWLPGRRVLLAPGWTDGIDWRGGHVALSITRQQLRESARFLPQAASEDEFSG